VSTELRFFAASLSSATDPYCTGLHSINRLLFKFRIVIGWTGRDSVWIGTDFENFGKFLVVDSIKQSFEDYLKTTRPSFEDYLTTTRPPFED
jgi:hypothetical protein